MSKLTKRDIQMVQLRSWMYQWKSFNYETMQSPGFTNAIGPAIEKIYDGNPELVQEKLQKYLTTFYNTTNEPSQIICGACLAIEESEVEGCTDTAIALRTGLMGPFAGIGDAIFRISPKVIFGSLAGYMALEGSLVGVGLGILVLLAFYFIKYNFFWLGYREGANFITSRTEQIKNLTNSTIILGLTMVGTMIPSTVKIKVKTVFTYGEATESIQDIINQIMPYLLPVVLTAVIYWLLGRKNFTTVRMVWIVIAFATLLTFVGIL